MELVSGDRITARVTFVGEGMVELSRAADGRWAMGWGGDVLNWAIHMARLGNAARFASALGSDPFSDRLRTEWAGQGLDVSAVLTDEARRPGLYAISLDERGERSFSYWRGESAARRLFSLPDSGAIRRMTLSGDVLCFSLITLAILPDAGRDTLLALAGDVRAGGGTVAFDGNYRADLWSSRAEAEHVRDAAIACADFGFPTLADELDLSGCENAAAVAEHWHRMGCGEVVVKTGARGCLLSDGRTVEPPAIVNPTDTSGAGDAFNAGYLDARLRGDEPARAALAGHELAAWTIQRTGAIPQPDAAAPYSA